MMKRRTWLGQSWPGDECGAAPGPEVRTGEKNWWKLELSKMPNWTYQDMRQASLLIGPKGLFIYYVIAGGGEAAGFITILLLEILLHTKRAKTRKT